MLEKFVSMLESANESPDAFGCGMLFLFMFFIFWSLIDSINVLCMEVIHRYRFRHLRKFIKEYISLYNSDSFSSIDIDYLRKTIVDGVLNDYGYYFDWRKEEYVRKPDFIDKLKNFANRFRKQLK